MKRAERKVLNHMARCHGAWMPEDPTPVAEETLEALMLRGWVIIDRGPGGEPACAILTALGRAARKWGSAHLVDCGP